MADNGHSDGAENVAGIGLVTVLLALIFLFVWPGPFRWEYSGGSPRTKIDRISGKTFVLTGEGWQKVATDVREDLSLAQYSDITANGKDAASLPTQWDQEFSLVVHNGSGYAITEVEVEAWRGKGEHGRVIRMKPESTIEPGASGGVSAVEVPDDLVLPSEEAAREFHWKIVGAKGYPLD